MWIMIRFKLWGGSREQLLSVYQLRVHSTLVFATPVFHSGLTQDQNRQVEMVQKRAFAMILGRNYENYETALFNRNNCKPEEPHFETTFAFKCTKSPKQQHMFPLSLNYREHMRHPLANPVVITKALFMTWPDC